MCGIAGFTSPDRDGRPVLAEMTAALRHRGPDGEGFHIDDGVAFGHRRLAVIDLGGGAQPRVDAATGDALVFNGEIYGYRQLAADLRRSGVPLADDSDTEVLFRLLQRHGVDEALTRIDGMFAFAFREGRSGKVHLVRDRFGEKPLFYAVAAGRLVFASEMKALRRHPALRHAALDRKALHQYLTFDYLPGALTGWEGLRKLPPGHTLTFGDGDVSIRRYWRLPLGAPCPVQDEEEAIERLEALLDESVRLRLVADVPVGVFLSGGVDSSLIAAIAARHAAGITAYTVRMPGDGYDESPFAAMVAKRHGLDHEVVDLTDAEVDQAFRAVGEALDEPLADSSLLPTYLVCKAARRSLTVALGGDGADELFAGYPNFKAQRLAPLMAALPRAAGEGLRRLVAGGASSGYMNPAFVLRQLAQGIGAPIARQSFLWMASFTEADKCRLWRADAHPGLDEDATFGGVEAWSHDAPDHPIDRLLYLFTVTYLPENILAKVDRASMYNSLEVRAPFLSRDFAAFAARLPRHWKIRGMRTKYLLKKLAARHVPEPSVYRAKHGFALPVADLLRGRLFEPARQVLLDPANPLHDLFDAKEMARLLDEHRAGRRDHRKKLWNLYVLSLVAGKA